jgi:hypothetical protein
MTSTDKKVTRVTTTPYRDQVGITGRPYGKPRRIAITIMPGDEIVLRPLRLRSSVSITVERLYTLLKAEQVRERNAERRTRRRSRSK